MSTVERIIGLFYIDGMKKTLLLSVTILLAGCGTGTSITNHIELYHPVSCLDAKCDIDTKCTDQDCKIKVQCCCVDKNDQQ